MYSDKLPGFNVLTVLKYPSAKTQGKLGYLAMRSVSTYRIRRSGQCNVSIMYTSAPCSSVYYQSAMSMSRAFGLHGKSLPACDPYLPDRLNVDLAMAFMKTALDLVKDMIRFCRV